MVATRMSEMSCSWTGRKLTAQSNAFRSRSGRRCACKAGALSQRRSGDGFEQGKSVHGQVPDFGFVDSFPQLENPPSGDFEDMAAEYILPDPVPELWR